MGQLDADQRCLVTSRGVRTYIAGMRRWMKAARSGDVKAAAAIDVPPVNVPPTPEWAEKVE